MKTSIRFFCVRLIRKAAKLLGYRVDFAPLSIVDTRDPIAEYLSALCKRTLSLEGSIVECGLGHGFSFAFLAKQGYDSGKKVFGFDSFAGFPKPSKEDVSSYAFKEGDWGKIELHSIETFLLTKVPKEYYEKEVKIIPGFFSESLKKNAADIEKICFLHLDVDLFQSYMDCLEALYDKVVSGGIIAFDESLNGIDYAKYPGGFAAIETFFADKEFDLSRDLKTGKYYIVKR